MTTRTPSRFKSPPLSYPIYRGVTVAAFVLLLLAIGLGAVGLGPAHALAGPTDTAVSWVKQQIGYANGP